MGLSIHYSGKFNKKAVLSDLIDEVKDIVETFNWEYKVHQKSFPINKLDSHSYDGEIYGISFTPPECETISISFLSNYRMSSNIHLKLYGKSESEFLYMLSCKTQFSCPSIHKSIIQLFHHLCKRDYFEELKLIDDGEYWRSGDEGLLEQKFKENGDLIDDFSIAVEAIPVREGESFEKYFERILKKINDRNKRIKSPNA
jgi:hypothetical protein